MIRKEAMYTAFWHCRDAAENASKAHTAIALGFPGNIYEECARDAFKLAADALGYDLVKRKVKQEEAA